jgi:hypothetical protein
VSTPTPPRLTSPARILLSRDGNRPSTPGHRAAWTAQSVAGWATYNAEQLSQRQDPVSWGGYLGAAEFWNRTLQNWQSELLAVGSFAVLAIFLRQRGSPESKRVGDEHGVIADSG